MDFFTAQDHARSNTVRLVVLFSLAVLSLVVMTNLVAMIALGLMSPKTFLHNFPANIDWEIFVVVSSVVLLVIIGGTLYKIRVLSTGGDAVAMMLGGDPVFVDDEDLLRRRFVNVVEEMSIAAGIPVPQPYVLPEDGINAFAAGFDSSDAVVAVTRGALRGLNREQLQGVVAHEFSHILNGDMRINVRLMGILHGILLIGFIGRGMLRGGGRSTRKGGGGILVLGLGCIVIGYAGSFFGNMIKAAVSRQREFLADAAAIQFTRNPGGIGEALLIIGGSQNGSFIKHKKGEEISHFFFGQALKVRMSSPFATHPPLPVRIKRILPAWDGVFPEIAAPKVFEQAAGPEPVSGAASFAASDAAQSVIGSPGDLDVGLGQLLLSEVPEMVKRAARGPFAARALIVYLILDTEEGARRRQLEILERYADRGVKVETKRLLRQNIRLPARLRLPVIDLALPSFRRLSAPQAKQFLQTLDALIQEDGRITLFEWCVRIIVKEYLHARLLKEEEVVPRRKNSRPDDYALVLSMLCHIASGDIPKEELFMRARQELNIASLQLLPKKDISFVRVEGAMQRLRCLDAKKKRRLFTACRNILLADDEITPSEAGVMRVISASLDIPAPPGKV